MSNIISNLFSGSAMKAVIDSGDMLIYTDEEKAKLKLELARSLKPFKLAQRFLAVLFALNFIATLWMGISIYLVSPDELDGFLKLINSFEIGWIMLAIISFYFTGGVIESFTNRKKI